MEPPPAQEVAHFKFYELRRVQISRENSTGHYHTIGKQDLLCSSNKYGLLFAALGHSNNFAVIRSSEVLLLAQTKEERKQHIDQFGRGLTTCQPGSVICYLKLSCDDRYLAVGIVHPGNGPSLLIYDVIGFASSPNNSVLHTIKPTLDASAHFLDVVWNPAIPSTFAVCTSDGSVGVYSIAEGKSFSVDGQLSGQQAHATTVCWSPKGKQLVIGDRHGQLTQLKPNLTKVKTISPPPGTSDQSVVSLLWVSNFVFAAVYAKFANSEDSPKLIIIHTPKSGEQPSYVNYDDLSYSLSKHKHPFYFLHHLMEWNLIVGASSNGSEIVVLGNSNNEKGLCQQWILDDNGRAELPLVDNNETFPLGYAVVTTLENSIPINDTLTLGPMPVLVVLNSAGQLCPYYMINTTPGIPSLVRPAEYFPLVLSQASQQPPSYKATVASVVPSTPVNPPPAFGAPGSGFAFGTPGNAPKPVAASTPFLGASKQSLANAGSLGGITIGKPFLLSAKDTDINSTVPTSTGVSRPVQMSLGLAANSNTIQPKAFPSKASQLADLTGGPQAAGAHTKMARPKMADHASVADTLGAPQGGFPTTAVTKMINGFQSELDQLKTSLSGVRFQVGSQEELANLRSSTIALDTFKDDMKSTIQSLNTDIYTLSETAIEIHGSVEDAKTRDYRLRNPRYHQLLRLRSLDPANARSLKSIREYFYYVETHVKELSAILEQKRIEDGVLQSQLAKARKPSTLEDIFRAVVTNQNLILALTRKINRLKLGARRHSLYLDSVLYEAANAPRSLDQSEKIEDLSELAEQLLHAKITPRASDRGGDSVPVARRFEKSPSMSPEKQAQLREAISNRLATPVRCASSFNPKQKSRLLSFTQIPYEDESYETTNQSYESETAEPSPTEVPLAEFKQTTSEPRYTERKTETVSVATVATVTPAVVTFAAQQPPSFQTATTSAFFTVGKGERVTAKPSSRKSSLSEASPKSHTSAKQSDATKLYQFGQQPADSSAVKSFFSPVQPSAASSITSSTKPTTVFGKAPLLDLTATTVTASKLPASITLGTTSTAFQSVKPSAAVDLSSKVKSDVKKSLFGGQTPVPQVINLSPSETDDENPEIQSFTKKVGRKPESTRAAPVPASVQALAKSMLNAENQKKAAPSDKLDLIVQSPSEASSRTGSTFSFATNTDSTSSTPFSTLGRDTPPSTVSGRSSATIPAAPSGGSEKQTTKKQEESVLKSALFGSTVTVPASTGFGSLTFGASPVISTVTAAATPVATVTSQSAFSIQPVATTTGASLLFSGKPLVGGSPWATTTSAAGTAEAPKAIFGSAVATTPESVFPTGTITTTPTTTAASSTSIFGGGSTTTPAAVFGSVSTSTASSIFGSSAVVPSFGTLGAAVTTSDTQLVSFGGGQPATNSLLFDGTNRTVMAVFRPPTSENTTSVSIFGGGAVVGATPMFATLSLTPSTTATGAAPFSFVTPTSPTPAVGFGNFGSAGSTTIQQTKTAFSAFGQSPNGAMIGVNAMYDATKVIQNPPSGFGSQQPLFGQQSPSMFGGSVSVSLFGKDGGSMGGMGLGGKPSEANANRNVFGGAGSFSGGSTSLFGGGTGTQANSFSNAVPNQSSFGSGPFSAGAGTVAQSGFALVQQPQTPDRTSGFGAPPAFGSSPAFGGSPAFGSTPSFGGSPLGPSIFGGGSTAVVPTAGFQPFSSGESAPTFGSIANQPNQTIGFGALATQQQLQQPTGFGFGTVAQQPAPTFGAFGQQQQAPAFGSTAFGGNVAPSFGSNPSSNWTSYR